MSKMQWKNLEFQTHQLLKKEGVTDCTLVAAVSGGADSVALLRVLVSLKAALRLKIVVAHFHHGKHSNLKFRNQAGAFCKALAKKYALPFESETSQKELKTEEACRNARYEFLEGISADFIVTAHHQDDLLETRIMRLIRGTGSNGLVGMKARSNEKLRPFLNFSREEILSYLKSIEQKFVEDPTNLDSEMSFRNWVRNEWLQALEKRSPGGVKSLGRSLENLTKSDENWPQEFVSKQGLSRPFYLALGAKQQISVLASLLQRSQINNFTLGQLLEVKKHLDKSQKNLTFTVGQVFWTVNAKQILAVSCLE